MAKSNNPQDIQNSPDNRQEPGIRSEAEGSFEKAILELEQIISVLESGNIHLEEAVSLYTHGQDLRQYCQQKLAEAELKIEQVTPRETP